MNAVGSLPWLIRNEMRLSWRATTAKIKPWMIGLLVVLGLAIVIVPMLFFAGDVRGKLAFNGAPPTWAVVLAQVFLLVSFTFMLSSTITSSVEALFERGDLDLLVSSPLDSKVIFASRALSVALKTFLSSLVLSLLIVIAGIFLGIWQLLGLMLALIALSFIATAFGMLVTLGLVRTIGARRTKTVAQVLSAVVGAAIYLASQSFRFLGNSSTTSGITGWLVRLFRGNVDTSSFWWFPAKAVFLDPISLMLMLVIGVIVLWFTTNLVHNTFILGTQTATTGGGKRLASSPSNSRGKPVKFASGLTRIVMNKEWRLIARDPYLISQLGLQMLYLLPAFFVFWQPSSTKFSVFGSSFASYAVNIFIVLLSGTLISRLTQIIVAGEEAPELLAMSPAGGENLRWIKFAGVLIPTILLFSPLLVLIVVRNMHPLVGLLAFFGTVLSLGILQVWNAKIQPRADLMKRGGRGDFLTGLIQGLVTLAWLAVVLGLESAQWWAWLGLGIGGLLPLVALSRPRSSLGY
jgi:ABC-2 type transport system permease protein